MNDLQNSLMNNKGTSDPGKKASACRLKAARDRANAAEKNANDVQGNNQQNGGQGSNQQNEGQGGANSQMGGQDHKSAAQEYLDIAGTAQNPLNNEMNMSLFTSAGNKHGFMARGHFSPAHDFMEMQTKKRPDPYGFHAQQSEAQTAGERWANNLHTIDGKALRMIAALEESVHHFNAAAFAAEAELARYQEQMALIETMFLHAEAPLRNFVPRSRHGFPEDEDSNSEGFAIPRDEEEKEEVVEKDEPARPDRFADLPPKEVPASMGCTCKPANNQ